MATGTNQLLMFLNRTRKSTDRAAILPLVTSVAVGVFGGLVVGSRNLVRNPDVVINHSERQAHADPTGMAGTHALKIGNKYHDHWLRRWLRARYFPAGILDTHGPFLQGPLYRYFAPPSETSLQADVMRQVSSTNKK